MIHRHSLRALSLWGGGGCREDEGVGMMVGGELKVMVFYWYVGVCMCVLL